jgi:MFS family permease
VAFAIVFGLAAVARLVSSAVLTKQSDPEPELIKRIEMPSLRTMTTHFDRRTRGLLFYMLAFFLSVFVVVPFFGPYLREQLHFEYWQIMAITVMTFVSKVLFLPFVGRITDRHGPGRVLWIGALVTAPAAVLWAVSDSFYWLLALQFYVGFGWACWETGSFLLVFDVIPAERRTHVMTMYQLVLAIMMVGGSLLGAGLLEGVGVNRTGYLALFIATSLMRFVSMFILATIEPSGLRLTHRVRMLGVWTLGLRPGGGDSEAIDDGPGDE